ncbi:hypothetical protein PIB30_044083 [Stylosanthes scabra]|uniref:RRM domain-containing protein n=1 Tax=Stylosanthes scabra TaxID=79078 RepID=A0ABU6XH10_9FABA|nr:hypothetical protein [Stylosanthes scabra]
MVGCNNNTRQQNDTNSTKIFVGGLAWETQKETLRRYFEEFGDILEAVVITDKNTGRSKGYGFNCYPIYGGQQFPPYYPSNNGAAGPLLGLIPNINHPLNAQYAHRYHSHHQGHGFGVKFPPHMMQIPILPARQYGSPGILNFPSSMPIPPITNAGDKLLYALLSV